MAVKNQAASTLARLKNQAKTEGINYQMCLQLFFQRSSCGDCHIQNTETIWCLRAGCSYIPLLLLTADRQGTWIF